MFYYYYYFSFNPPLLYFPFHLRLFFVFSFVTLYPFTVFVVYCTPEPVWLAPLLNSLVIKEKLSTAISVSHSPAQTSSSPPEKIGRHRTFFPAIVNLKLGKFM